MITFESQQTIDRPAAEVWAYAADIRRHPDWMNVSTARVIDGDGTEVGARGEERMGFGPWHWDVGFEVTEAVPDRRITWTGGRGAPFDAAVSLDLDPVAPTRTLATYTAELTLHGLWRLLSPIVALELKDGPARELLRLKERVEGQPAPSDRGADR